MANQTSGNFVAYYRVSTQRQGRSGLGLEAQRKAVQDHLNGGNWRIVAEYTEVESGKRKDRPKLADALKACRVHGAKLIIAKLDRLARNVAFVSNLMESGVDFEAVDFPQANRLTIHILAAVAEHEAKAISERTRAALAAAKRRGVKLGGYRGAKLTAKARMAGCKARIEQADAKAAGSCPDHQRATGGRLNVATSHRSGIERAGHSDGERTRRMAGCAGIEGVGAPLERHFNRK
jgi:DNA invertase Pin-like site-specific DNA recombinase